jgi:hypothetical protein
MLSLRDVRMLIIGMAGVWFLQWVQGVPSVWSPGTHFLILIAALPVVMALEIWRGEKADA